MSEKTESSLQKVDKEMSEKELSVSNNSSVSDSSKGLRPSKNQQEP